MTRHPEYYFDEDTLPDTIAQFVVALREDFWLDEIIAELEDTILRLRAERGE